MCVAAQHPSNLAKTHLNLLHHLEHSITIAWPKTAPHLDSPSSSYAYLKTPPKFSFFLSRNPSRLPPLAAGHVRFGPDVSDFPRRRHVSPPHWRVHRPHRQARRGPRPAPAAHLRAATPRGRLCAPHHPEARAPPHDARRPPPLPRSSPPHFSRPEQSSTAAGPSDVADPAPSCTAASTRPLLPLLRQTPATATLLRQDPDEPRLPHPANPRSVPERSNFVLSPKFSDPYAHLHHVVTLHP